MNVKLSFWTRSSQKNKQQKVPIYMRIQFNNVRTQSSVGVYINLSQWDKKGERVKGLSAESEAINGKLDALKSRVIKVYNELLLSGKPFNAFTIKENILNEQSQAITFDDIMNEYLDKMKSLIGKSYAKPTIIKYKNSQVRVSEYVLKRYKRNHIYLYELNFEFIEGFETFLKKNYDNSNTTIAKHYQRISRVVSVCKKTSK